MKVEHFKHYWYGFGNLIGFLVFNNYFSHTYGFMRSKNLP